MYSIEIIAIVVAGILIAIAGIVCGCYRRYLRRNDDIFLIGSPNTRIDGTDYSSHLV
jgi:hypothetical protein